MAKHPNDMSREELRELVSAMGWLALDLAQHLCYSEGLKPEYKDEAYKKATGMAYHLVNLQFNFNGVEKSKADITVFGADGLEKVSSFVTPLKQDNQLRCEDEACGAPVTTPGLCARCRAERRGL